MSENLLSSTEVIRAGVAAAAGLTDVDSDGVSSENAEGIVFVASIGSIVATGIVDAKLQASDDDGVTDAYSDIAGTAATQLSDADDNKMVVIELHRPLKKYTRMKIVRATANSSVDSIVAMKTRSNKSPVTQGATVASAEVHASPAEGTA